MCLGFFFCAGVSLDPTLMFRHSLLALRVASHMTRKRRFLMKTRGHRHNMPTPWSQAEVARSTTVEKIAKYRNIDVRNPNVRRAVEESVYGSGRLSQSDAAVNRTFSLQGLGDDEPLSSAMNRGLTDLQRFTYVEDVENNVEPPEPYTPLMRRKLAEGKFWPEAPEQPLGKVREFHTLRNEETSSPSSNRFTAAIEYYLRRNLRAMPAHIAEKIDFAQLVIDRVYGSRRSTAIYIVWSTVDPMARHAIEPYITQLNGWVIRTILRRIKIHPNIPKVHWVYTAGKHEEAIPPKLKQELRAASESATETIEERVAYLKAADSLQHRMKGIPWFMPYLWAKDKRAKDDKTMHADLDVVSQRRARLGDGEERQPINRNQTWQDYQRERADAMHHPDRFFDSAKRPNYVP